MKIKLLFFFILFGEFICKAQDTITISPIVGNIIDSTEKKEHHIFIYYSSPQFIQAVFIRNVDSSVTLKAMLKPDSTVERLIGKDEFSFLKNMIEGKYSVENSATSKTRNKIYNAKITLMNGEKEKGVLYQANDNSIETHKKEISVTTIKSIQLSRVGRGRGSGALVGMGIGIMLGLMHGNDPTSRDFNIFFVQVDNYTFTAGDKAMIYGLAFSLPGMAIGGKIGAASSSIRIPINGSESKYKSVQKTLKNYSSYR